MRFKKQWNCPRGNENLKKSHSDSKATGWESNQSKWDYWTINMIDIMNIVIDIIKKIYVSLITPPKKSIRNTKRNVKLYYKFKNQT